MAKIGRPTIDDEPRDQKVWVRETSRNVERLRAVARDGESPAQTMRRLARQMLDIIEGASRG